MIPVAHPSWWDGGEVAATLTKQNANGAQRMPDKDNFGAVLQPIYFPWQMGGTIQMPVDKDLSGSLIKNQTMAVAFGGDIARSLTARHDSSPCADRGMDVVAVMQPVAFAQNQLGEVRTGEVLNTLNTNSNASGRNTPMVAQPVAFTRCDNGQDAAVDVTPTMRCGSNYSAHLAVAQPMAVDFRHTDLTGDTAHTIQAKKTGGFSLNYQPGVMQAMQVRRLTPVECSRLQGFPDTYLELTYGTESEAHASQVLHELWRQTGTIAREGWRLGIIASLLTPEVLLAGVYGGWVSWKVAASCACSSGEISGKVNYAEGFVRRLQEAGQDGRSPYQRESFRQLAGELGCSLSQLPLEEAQAREILFCSELWSEAQRTWPLRYALATETQRRSGKLNADGPRYKALGNSMAVPVMRWIGERINEVSKL